VAKSSQTCEEAGAQTLVTISGSRVGKIVSLCTIHSGTNGDITYTTVPHKGPGLYPAQGGGQL